ncbi:MAG: hypothetical protein LIR50_20705 [Bacillota bacterium]|nr:hypothetical protein [Bacillota bacterium]
MAVFSWILLITAALYGALSAYGGFAGLKDKETSLYGNVLMILGGAIILIAAVPEVLEKYQLILLISGLIIIHAAAVLNGIKLYGKITVKHHVFRLFLSAIIILLYFIK